MISDVRSAIRRWDERHAPDDAPVWAEVVGALLAPGLFLRDGLHVYAALVTGADPHLTDGHDVQAASPVRGCRESIKSDVVARGYGLLFGAVAFALVAPLSLPVHPAVTWFLAAQLLVPLADPLLAIIHHIR